MKNHTERDDALMLRSLWNSRREKHIYIALTKAACGGRCLSQTKMLVLRSPGS